MRTSLFAATSLLTTTPTSLFKSWQPKFISRWTAPPVQIVVATQSLFNGVFSAPSNLLIG
jgi:hypothetical protein